MALEFQEYKVRKIVNVHRHTDSWFWDKYSAMPYVGCRSGCEFFYLRGGTYLGRRDPNVFDSQIRVKINAAEPDCSFPVWNPIGGLHEFRDGKRVGKVT